MRLSSVSIKRLFLPPFLPLDVPKYASRGKTDDFHLKFPRFSVRRKLDGEAVNFGVIEKTAARTIRPYGMG